jgi:very-short-patch-repair endonuclease
MPLRLLMKHCPDVIRAIKPCFMMSPQTVAQLLDADLTNFDLIIFDEASQLPTEDAVGTIIRGNQAVVVGDPKQLPPTNFFAVMSGQVNTETDEGGLPLFDDSESILEEMLKSGVPNHRLKWHYRSSHESLITFSNVSFYDSDLYTFPNVETDAYDSGLHFEYVAEGIYEGKGLNMAEARRVADAVVEHAKKNPQVSLGVGTFNLRQQLAIQDELEQRRREDISLEPFFDRNKSEPFFVKNLENIQGDERDVIFLSVTYAKAHDGKLRYNFGPLNGENGWRRMNVLVTRAKKLMRVFSSIKAEDINLAASASRGATLLRDFLAYAEHKRLDNQIISAINETESPFEREVFEELSRRGISLIPQVGASGYRIDFGVLDDEAEGKFVCGIECDGVSYHSSETARDRDRLRQQVLEARGWDIHRVWSTDWFKDRSGQIERLISLIEHSRERTKQESKQETEHQLFIESESEQQARDFLGDLSEIEIGGIFENIEHKNYTRPTAEPYKMTQTNTGFSSQSLLNVSEQQIAKVILMIIEQEAPIHVKDIFTRTASIYGQKAGSNISARIMDVLHLMERAKLVEIRNEFIWEIDGKIRIRSRNGTNIPAERIAPEEICEVILLILNDGHKFNKQSLINEVRTVFGFNRTGASLQEAIETVIDSLLSDRKLGEGSTGIGIIE